MVKRKEKKEGRSVYMSEKTWAYIDSLSRISNRSPSQEIEYSVLMLQKHRHKSDQDAINLADQSNQAQSSS